MKTPCTNCGAKGHLEIPLPKDAGVWLQRCPVCAGSGFERKTPTARTDQFQFPNRCARCGLFEGHERWTISSTEVEIIGQFQTTRIYSIAIPVCRYCARTLKRLKAGSYLVGAIVSLSAFLALFLALSLKGVEHGLILWGGPVLLGCLAGPLSYSLFVWKSGLNFASIGSGGRSLVFTNATYQREFDRMNGQPLY